MPTGRGPIYNVEPSVRRSSLPGRRFEGEHPERVFMLPHACSSHCRHLHRNFSCWNRPISAALRSPALVCPMTSWVLRWTLVTSLVTSLACEFTEALPECMHKSRLITAALKTSGTSEQSPLCMEKGHRAQLSNFKATHFKAIL
jgi:hypothetical protein